MRLHRRGRARRGQLIAGVACTGPSRQRVLRHGDAGRLRFGKAAFQRMGRLPLPVPATTRPFAGRHQGTNAVGPRAGMAGDELHQGQLPTRCSPGQRLARRPLAQTPHAALLDARQRPASPGQKHRRGSCGPCARPAPSARASQHRHHAARSGSRASVTASSRFCGPSRNSAVARRIAAASTTGSPAPASAGKHIGGFFQRIGAVRDRPRR